MLVTCMKHMHDFYIKNPGADLVSMIKDRIDKVNIFSEKYIHTRKTILLCFIQQIFLIQSL